MEKKLRKILRQNDIINLVLDLNIENYFKTYNSVIDGSNRDIRILLKNIFNNKKLLNLKITYNGDDATSLICGHKDNVCDFIIQILIVAIEDNKNYKQCIVEIRYCDEKIFCLKGQIDKKWIIKNIKKLKGDI